MKSFDQESGEMKGGNAKMDSRFRTFSLDLEKPAAGKVCESRGSGRKYGRQGSAVIGGDTKVLVVWLESYEDHSYFPISECIRLSCHIQAIFRYYF